MLSFAHRNRSMHSAVTEPGLSKPGLSTIVAHLEKAVEQHEVPVYIVGGKHGGAPSLTFEPASDGEPVGYLPGIRPENLGDASFTSCHGVRFQYVCGEMANGIATVEMVVESARTGWLGFFGAAGLHAGDD